MVVGSSENGGNKRKLPSWQSSNKKPNINNRNDQMESGEDKDNNNVGEELENSKVKSSEIRSASANKKSGGEDFISKTHRVSGCVRSDNDSHNTVSDSAEIEGLPIQRKGTSQESEDSSHNQQQSLESKQINLKIRGIIKAESNKQEKRDETQEKAKAQYRQKKPPLEKFLDGVIFALSGLVNPERANIREFALEMGAQYRPDWTSDCTLLVCAFPNTPKFNQVKNDNGTIVSKAWILDCYEQKELLEIDKYLMYAGKPWRKVGVSVFDGKDGTSGEKISKGHKKSEDPRLTIASLPQIEQWVHMDVASSIAWLQKQENHPKQEELTSIAIQGIQLCLEDTITCLKNKQSIDNILETWDFVPRAVRELSNREKSAKNRQGISSNQDLLSEAERLKWIYALELKKVNGEAVNDLRSGNEDDDSTDKMSETSGSNTESDNETEILGEEDIIKAKEKIKKRLAEKAS